MRKFLFQGLHRHLCCKISFRDLEESCNSSYTSYDNPFISKHTQKLGRIATLLAIGISCSCLLIAYIVSFYAPSLAACFLVFTYFFSGTQACVRSLRQISCLNIDIQVLMTTSAFLSALIGKSLEGGLLLCLFFLSETIENMVTQKTKGALYSLQKMSPTFAYIINQDGSITARSIHDLTLGTKIFIKAGEMIPLDGKILEGSSYVNLAHLTGESIPIPKKKGDEVQAGSLNIDGSLTVQITKTSANSTLSKIIYLITKAQEAKPRIQSFLDRFSRAYATSIILFALFLAISLPFFFPTTFTFFGDNSSIYRSLAFLIAASPCALIIAIPTAYFSALSACAHKGILLKGGIILDGIGKCKLLALDKTGTLTTGRLQCKNIEVDGSDVSPKQAIALAASLEQTSHHPIATSILQYAESQNIRPKKISHVRTLPGKGVEGFYHKERVIIGNVNFVLSTIQDESKKQSIRKKIQFSGHIVALLLIKNTFAIFHFTDELRPHLSRTIQQLKKHLQLVIITGDHEENASLVAKSIGIQKIYANLSPEDKLHIIQTLNQKYPLMMVGDGLSRIV